MGSGKELQAAAAATTDTIASTVNEVTTNVASESEILGNTSYYFFDGLPHVHHLLVLLFTISITYKAILLLGNKLEKLEEIVIETISFFIVFYIKFLYNKCYTLYVINDT